MFFFLGKGLSFFLWEAKENRKGAVKPRPLCTPLGLFLKSSWLWGCGAVLACFCMLRCWTWDAVPKWLLYSSVLHVRRYADTATFSQFRTGRKRPLPSFAVGVSAGDVASVRAVVEEV